MLNEEDRREIKKTITEEMRKIFAQSDAVKKSIKQRHLEGNLIFFGLDADKPNGSTEVKCWFSIDTNTLYLWNGSVWVGEELT